MEALQTVFDFAFILLIGIIIVAVATAIHQRREAHAWREQVDDERTRE